MTSEPSVPVINFTSPAMRHRLLQGGGRGQDLAKAVGLGKGRTLEIVDTTAGLGRDGFVLAHLGAQVTMIERNPDIANALKKALTTARASEPLFAEPAHRITLICGDARDVLPKLNPVVSYVDPMHPTRSKSALVKQPMRDLRDLVGADTDSAELIWIALTASKKRVVVKWPKSATLPEGLPEPTYERIGKTTRYFVFIDPQPKMTSIQNPNIPVGQ